MLRPITGVRRVVNIRFLLSLKEISLTLSGSQQRRRRRGTVPHLALPPAADANDSPGYYDSR